MKWPFACKTLFKVLFFNAVPNLRNSQMLFSSFIIRYFIIIAYFSTCLPPKKVMFLIYIIFADITDSWFYCLPDSEKKISFSIKFYTAPLSPTQILLSQECPIMVAQVPALRLSIPVIITAWDIAESHSTFRKRIWFTQCESGVYP